MTIIQELTRAVAAYSRRQLDNAWGRAPEGSMETAEWAAAVDDIQLNGLRLVDRDGLGSLSYTSVVWAKGVATFTTERGIVIGEPYKAAPMAYLA